MDKGEVITGKSLANEAGQDGATGQHVASPGYAPRGSKSSEHGPRLSTGAYSHGWADS